ncbi:hypothetical protein Salat_1187300 [Sesamum alatum]|uniref:Uncharacterized protein n=1 Tax=Sesamum alatum TaxID=300844 RepID=A0AAE1YEV7_9LAMI|nr:hypothetical protein Salat_1187300 [Sesamum alatum]
MTIAESSSVECDENSDFSLHTSSIGISDVWVLDSACSHHICPHQDWFFDFKELNGGVVYTTNNIPLTTFGCGSVRLKNQDGSIITLTGVRFVPELMKNLIYVGTLESKGFEVRAKDGVMKIISGARVVIKGIRKNNNLYHYSGSTVIGTVAATSMDDQESEGIKLCYIRLGHADYDSLHVFGSTAYYHVKESKLDPRAKKAIFLGITSGIKGYRLWCPEMKKIIFNTDVTFDESTMLKKVDVEQSDDAPKQVEFERVVIPADEATDEDSSISRGEGDSEGEEVQT